jgi:hypothetical protein
VNLLQLPDLNIWTRNFFVCLFVCLLFVRRKEGERGGIYNVLDRRKGVNHWVGGN